MPKTITKKPAEKSKALYVSRCRQRQKRLVLRRVEVAALFKNLAPLADEIDLAKKENISKPVVEFG